jgi:flavorubredoxin
MPPPGGRDHEGDAMETAVDEIADGIYRISTWIPDVAPPKGLSFNQFLVDADHPLLFHTGMRALFPLVSEAVSRIRALHDLRWISFGHVEADECGAANLFLDAAPSAAVVHGPLACEVSLNDLCDRPPVALPDGEVLDLGGKRIRRLDTPHIPHNWEASVIYEETTGTLLCGDLFTHLGNGPAVTDAEIVGPALEFETMFTHYNALPPHFGVTLSRLADLRPSTLALMHGSSHRGDGRAAIESLANAYDERFLATG